MTANRPLLGILVAITLIACGSGTSVERTMTGEEALNQVKELVEATLAEVAPGAELTPDAVPGGTTCENSLTGTTGQRSYGYGFNFPVSGEATGERLVREVASFWKKRGREVGGDFDDEYSPFVHTSKDGFDFDFTFARQTLRASVGGSTPCVDPLPGEA